MRILSKLLRITEDKDMVIHLPFAALLIRMEKVSFTCIFHESELTVRQFLYFSIGTQLFRNPQTNQAN